DATSLVDDNGGTTPVANEPRADITAISVNYQPGSMVLSAHTAQPVNPSGDPAWGTSDVTWFIDTNGDKKFDYSIEYGADSGNLYADVYNAAGTIVCAGGAVPSLAQDGSYVVTVQSKCFNNPAAFNWGGRTEWA